MNERPRRAATVAGRERTRAWYAYMAGRSTEGPNDPVLSPMEEEVGGGGGRAWTALELKLLHEGYSIFGNRWGLVAEHVGTRSYAAVKRYYDRHVANGSAKKGLPSPPAAASMLRTGKKPSTPLIRPTVNHDNDSLNDEEGVGLMNKMPPAITTITVATGKRSSKTQEEGNDSDQEAKTTSKEAKKLCKGCEAKCDLCDVVGTSSKLVDYFEGVRAKKIDFHQRWRSTKRTNKKKSSSETRATAPFDEYLEANKEFIDHLVHKEYADMKKAREKASKTNKADPPCQVKASELSPLIIQQVVQTISIEEGHSLIVDPTDQQQQNDDSDDGGADTPTMTEEDHSNIVSAGVTDQNNTAPPAEIDTSVNNVHDTNGEPNLDSGAKTLNAAHDDIDASFFVGKPIRLFCKTENAYHTGRIIDWRCQAPVREASNYNLDLSATRGKKRQLSVLDVGAGEPVHKSRGKKRGRRRQHRNYVGDGSIIEFYDKLLRARERAKSGADGDFFGRVSAVSDEVEKHLQQDDKLKTQTTERERTAPVKVPSRHAEYLVRFKAGIDGRKVAVHMWIVLEEHALSVGVGTVWGYIGEVDPSLLSSVPTKKEKWRPAMLHLRSALEMVPMTELNAHLFRSSIRAPQEAESQPNAAETHDAAGTTESLQERQPLSSPALRSLCLFFGPTTTRTVLPVKDACVDFFSPDFQTNTAASSALIAAGLPPPSHTTSLAAKLVEKSQAVATTMACMEMHEQRRLRQWHKLDFLKRSSACSVDAISLKTSDASSMSEKKCHATEHEDVIYVPREKSKIDATLKKGKRDLPNIPLQFWSSPPKCSYYLEKEYLCSL